jgi:hypothetical protein
VGIFNILKNVFGHLLPLPLPLPLPLSMSMSMSMSKSAGPLRQRRGGVQSAITKKGPGWVSKQRPSVSEGYALPAELEVQVRVVRGGGMLVSSHQKFGVADMRRSAGWCRSSQCYCRASRACIRSCVWRLPRCIRAGRHSARRHAYSGGPGRSHVKKAGQL